MITLKLPNLIAKRALCFLLLLFSFERSVSNNDSINKLIIAGNAIYSMKFSYPVKNFKTYDWDNALLILVDKIKHVNTNISLVSTLNNYFKKISQNIIISNSKLNIDSILVKQGIKNKKIYYYLHHGNGIDNMRFGFIKNKLYRTEIIRGDLDSIILKKLEIQFSDSVFMYIVPPTKIQRLRTINNYEEKETYIARLRNYNYRAASLLKLYFVSDLFSPINNPGKDSLEETLKRCLKKTTFDQTDFTFEETVRTFLCALNDGHAEFAIGYNRGIVSYFKPKFYPKINTRIYNYSLFITQVDSSLNKLLLIGDQIISINGIPSHDLIKRKSKLVSASTSQHKILKSNSILFESPKKDSTYLIMIDRQNSKFEVSINSSNYFIYQEKNKRKPIEMLSDSIVLINLTDPLLTTKKIRKTINILKKSKGIIFDLRGYPNYKADKILSYFINKEVKVADFKVPLFQNITTLNKYDSSSWVIKPKNYINKNYVFITHSTFSWGETLLEAIKYYKLGTIVGEPSCGISGDIEKISLPLGYFTYTGLVFNRNGINPLPIIPDVYVASKHSSLSSEQDYFVQEAKLILLKNDK